MNIQPINKGDKVFEMPKFRPISDMENKSMSNGMRDQSGTPLTEEEIEKVKKAIKRIKADETVFVFNDSKHIKTSTCYNYIHDKVYVSRNVFPDDKYASSHPRDLMSIASVLSHEYYGHRTHREEYLSDMEKGCDYHTLSYWEDECRASIEAAQIAPGLSERERCDLVMDAVYRAKEAGQLLELNEFMKEVLYGYTEGEREITGRIEPYKFVSIASQERDTGVRLHNDPLSEVPICTEDDYYPTR